MQDELLTTKQVAALWKVSVHTVARWVRDGRVQAIRTPGGELRFRPSDVLPSTTEPAA